MNESDPPARPPVKRDLDEMNDGVWPVQRPVIRDLNCKLFLESCFEDNKDYTCTEEVCRAWYLTSEKQCQRYC